MDPLTPGQDVSIAIAIELELRLLQPQVRASPGEVEALLHPDFFEFGASGSRWDRSEAITALAAGQPAGADAPVTATEIAGVRLADDVIHLTYVSQRDGRRARRSSVWLRTPDGWRLYFHQGTPAGPGTPPRLR